MIAALVVIGIVLGLSVVFFLIAVAWLGAGVEPPEDWK